MPHHDNSTSGNQPHEAKLSHELIAGAASFAAMKAYQDHEKKQGKTTSHETAKELLAAAGGALLTHVVETKGLDAVDNYKAKKAQGENHYENYTENRHENRHENHHENHENRHHKDRY
uniref:CipC2 protein n=2 Tax=Paxillus involutus TaxID=71150 RepID=Q5V8L3_PAXIN|nr:CipC2 protein [Paxillus involutus]